MRRFAWLTWMLLLPAVALAQAGGAPRDAHGYYLQGAAAFSDQRFEEAVVAWEHAYDLEPRPRIQYNLGQAYDELGDLERARNAYQRFLDGSSQSDEGARVAAQARLASLRERLAQTGLQLVGAPNHAAIFIDRQSWGQTPRPDPIPLAPGRHRVRLTHGQYGEFVVDVVVQGGGTTRVPVVMNGSAGAFSTPTGSFSRIPAYSLLGAGLGVSVAGAGLSIFALKDARGAESSDGRQADRSRRRALISDVLMGVGVATAAAGLIWLLTRLRHSNQDTLANVRFDGNHLEVSF